MQDLHILRLRFSSISTASNLHQQLYSKRSLHFYDAKTRNQLVKKAVSIFKSIFTPSIRAFFASWPPRLYGMRRVKREFACVYLHFNRRRKKYQRQDIISFRICHILIFSDSVPSIFSWIRRKSILNNENLQ